MKFWKDNKVNQELEIHPETILNAYLLSEQFKNWQEGANFDRGLAIFLTDNYGTFEQADFFKLGDYIIKNWESKLKGNIILGSLK